MNAIVFDIKMYIQKTTQKLSWPYLKHKSVKDFPANFSKRKRKRQRKKSPTPPIKEKEKEKEKDDDDSYVRVRACA